MTAVYRKGFESGSIDQMWSHDNVGGSSMDDPTTRGARAASSLKMGSGGVGIDLLENPVSEFYFGFGFRTSDPSIGDTGVIFLSDLGNDQVRLVTNTSSRWVVRRGATVLATGTHTMAMNTWYYVEIYLLINGSTGKGEVHHDGATDIALTTGLNTKGDAGSAVVERVYYWRSGNLAWYDDVYMNDPSGTRNNGFLGDRKIIGLFPNAVGDNTALARGGADSGSNWGQVDEKPPNDATDYVGSNITNDYDLYNLPNITGLSDVDACAVWLDAEKSDAGAAKVATMLSSGGTTATGADQTLGTAWAYYHQLYDAGPTDNASWTVSKINALQIGEKVR